MDDIEYTESAELRQGDVIKRVVAGVSEFRIIITTNCDIRFNKHRAVITTIRLMDAREYVSSFVLLEEISKYREQLYDRVVMEKNKRIDLSIPVRKISDERFLEWITEDEVSPELRTLFCEWPEVESYRKILTSVDLRDDQSVEMLFQIIKDFREIGIGKSARNLAIHVADKIKSPPGDFVFVAGGACLTEIFGYVASLRDIAVIEDSAIDTARWARPRANSYQEWVKVAKIKDYFLHNILQRFGLVFSSIGMPADFEVREKTSRELLAEYIEENLNA